MLYVVSCRGELFLEISLDVCYFVLYSVMWRCGAGGELRLSRVVNEVDRLGWSVILCNHRFCLCLNGLLCKDWFKKHDG
jgi:hypothetical protein